MPDVFLYAGEVVPSDVRLSDPTVLVSGALFVDPGAIATAEAFGVLVVDRPHVDPVGIPSAEVFGALSADLTLNPAGIPSAEAFGTAALVLHLNPTGIASAEAFGAVTLPYLLHQPGGIVTAEAFGVASLALTLDPIGIPSAEAFGSGASIEFPIVELPSVGGIVSSEAFGDAVVGVVTEQLLVLAPFVARVDVSPRRSLVPASFTSAVTPSARSGIARYDVHAILVFEPEEV